MTVVADLYAAQPFWIWLAVGVFLLAVESMFSTEWLLWPAVAAGLVAVMTAVGVRLGLPGEVAVFAQVESMGSRVDTGGAVDGAVAPLAFGAEDGNNTDIRA